MLFFSAPSLALVCVYMCFLQFFSPFTFPSCRQMVAFKTKSFCWSLKVSYHDYFFEKRFSSRGELEIIQLRGKTNKARRGGRVWALILTLNPKCLASSKFGENSQASGGDNAVGERKKGAGAGGIFVSPAPSPQARALCGVCGSELPEPALSTTENKSNFPLPTFYF